VKNRSGLPVVLPLIRVIREQRVILDSDLARLYGVSTSRLNQQFRRNRRRFPPDFAFPMTRAETAVMLSQIVTASKEQKTTEGMMSQIVTSSGRRNRRRAPIAYTEHGAVMAANILKSARAVAMSVEVVRAFVQLCKIASSHDKIARLLVELETAVVGRLDRHDKEIGTLFRMMAALVEEDPEENQGAHRVGRA